MLPLLRRFLRFLLGLLPVLFCLRRRFLFGGIGFGIFIFHQSQKV